MHKLLRIPYYRDPRTQTRLKSSLREYKSDERKGGMPGCTIQPALSLALATHRQLQATDIGAASSENAIV